MATASPGGTRQSTGATARMARWGYVDGDTLSSGNASPPTVLTRKVTDPPSDVRIINKIGGLDDAHSNAPPRLLMARQDGAKARSALQRYYAYMATLIHFPPASGTGVEGGDTGVEASDATSAGGDGFEEVRLVGVIRAINEPSARGDELYAPWELEPLDTAADAPTLADDAPEGSEATNKRVLQLYARNVARFTGLYLGCVIGAIGGVHRRDRDGRVTAILLRRVILPQRITVPWAPLSAEGARRVAHPAVSPATQRRAVRVHFCCGPFPRRDVADCLREIGTIAVTRRADVLIIGGPIIREFAADERMAMITEQRTFDDQLGAVLDGVLESTAGRTKVVVVPSLEDPTAFPVLPQPPFSLAGEETLAFCSNPGEVVVDGLRFGFTTVDAIGEMREKLVERWPTLEGSLHRVAEALIASRLYVPLTDSRSSTHDLPNLDALRLEGSSERGAPTSPPHFIFMPSQKPKFAHVVHTSNGHSDLADPGDGPMVINPGLMNRRLVNQPFYTVVAEVTVENAAAVLQHGPSVDGVNVRTVRVFDKQTMEQ